MRFPIAIASLSFGLLLDPVAKAQHPPFTSANWSFESDEPYARAGWTCANAGDINADGYDDALVAAPWHDAAQGVEGRVWMFLGGPSGLSIAPSWSFDGPTEGDSAGVGLSAAGDVNGDGYSDVLIGAPLHDNGHANEGRVWLFLGGPAGLGAMPSWSAEGDQVDAHFGETLSAAGDVNGDGFADFVVGAPYFDNGQSDEGAVWLFLGGSGGPGVPVLVGEGEQGQAYFGSALSGGGDVDGDGFDDVVIGAYSYDGSALNSGRAWLHRGTSTGLSGAVWTTEFGQAGAYAGQGVAIAGDINGDGFADIAVGGSQWDGANQTAGAIAVHYGSTSGPSLSTFYSPDVGSSELGAPLASTDINGDGFADLVVSAPLWDSAGVNAGRVLVMFGGPAGLTIPHYDLLLFADSPQAHAEFGVGLAAGDFNGDGFGDALVGERSRDNGETDEGRAWCFHGRALMPSPAQASTLHGNSALADFGSTGALGDFNGDGFADLAVGSPHSVPPSTSITIFSGGAGGIGTTPSWTFASEEGDRLGAAVATGDVDGDGFDDVVVGAPLFSVSTLGALGRVLLFRGSPSGLGALPTWEFAASEPVRLGTAVACGDITGDGLADIAVGAPFYSTNFGAQQGSVLIFRGASGGPRNTPDQEVTMGDPGARLGSAVAIGADVNGDGYDDLVVGAPRSSVHQSLAGAVHLFQGGPLGLGPTPYWSMHSTSAGQMLGWSVVLAGDLDGDGNGDLVVGGLLLPCYAFRGRSDAINSLPDWTLTVAPNNLGCRLAAGGDFDRDGLADFIVAQQGASGRVSVVLGRPLATPATSDLGAAAAWSFQPALGSEFQYGAFAAGQRDIDGDGYPDVVVGAPKNGNVVGRSYVYYGNSQLSPACAPIEAHQRRALSGAPISVVGRSDTTDSFVIRAKAHNPADQPGTSAGRARARLVWEVKPQGFAFDGTGLGASAWVDTGSAGPVLEFDEVVTGLLEQTRYRWRARFETNRLGFARTPWFSAHGRSANDIALRTGADCNANLQEDLLDIAQSASPDQNANSVPDECEGGPFVINYCTAGTTTNGCNATMSAIGVAVQGASSGFVLRCDNVEGQKQGLFFYGVSGRHNSTWGGSTSLLCVKSPTQRMGTLLTGGSVNGCDGVLQQDWSLWLSTRPGALGQPFVAGDTAWAQAWFRDPPSAKTTNLSDGLEFLVTP